ncbi:MAG TPA: PD-(D/E)XK nuclease family protein [Thermotogota bacterium]|mgnify:CR=1 FL=1|nr:PD-(D/E)XK nuclease family protein [Thermotogota bacterium]
MHSISFSQYSTFKDCQHKWELVYGLGIREYLPGIDSILGTALHETLQYYLDVLYNNSNDDAADALDLSKILYNNMTKIINEIKEQHNIEPTSFLTKDILYEYYYDGVEILKYFLENRQKYFQTRSYKLLGCEIKLEYPIRENLNFIGYIDVCVINEKTNDVYLYDFKKSYRGWKDNTKNSKIKRAQLQLYKLFYSRVYNVPLEKIHIEYIILKQKIYEGSEWKPSRIQRYEPPNSKKTILDTEKDFIEFINYCYTEEGNININNIYIKQPSVKNCKYCPFKNNTELCDKKNSRV